MGLLAQGVLRIESEDAAGLIRNRRIVHLRVARRGSPAGLADRASLMRRRAGRRARDG